MLPTADGRSPLHAEIEFRIREDHDRLMLKCLRPWDALATNQSVRVPRFDGRELNFGGIAFSGTIRRVFWEGFIDPYLKDLAIRQARDAVGLADERSLDRQQALRSAAGTLKLCNRATYHRMSQMDAKLRSVHHVKETWKHPNESDLTKQMNSFVDDVIDGWLVAAPPVSLSHRKGSTEAIASREQAAASTLPRDPAHCTIDDLEPAIRQAWQLYLFAQEQAPELKRDKEVLAWLRARVSLPYALPAKSGTWQRRISEARRRLGQAKNTRRTGRDPSGSVARPDQL
jgi:hypothetical protein